MKEFIEKLIGRLEEEKKYCSYHPHTRDEAINKAIQIVNKLEEEYINASTDTSSGWIACSERLPEERDWYLAVFQEGDSGFVLVPRVADYVGLVTKNATYEGWIIIDMEDGMYEYYRNLKCIAWQSLPEPYKKGE